MDRYLKKVIHRDLQDKMVFLSGPRQSGKTTLAQTLIQSKSAYFNYDVPSDRKKIRLRDLDESQPRIVLDELHKMPKWKSYLKGLYDERKGNQSYLVTGSARLETFQRQGDALTGRYYAYHLHPICPAEASAWKGAGSHAEVLNHLLKTGGFPEAYFHPKNADRLREGRFEAVVREDLRDLSRVLAIRQFEVLIEILRDRGAGQISYSGLAEDLSVSVPTVKQWLAWLERLYVIFMVYPWSAATSRSLRKEPKFYFYDCAANINPGLRLENAVACALVKHIDFLKDTTGRRLELRYFRDREGHEVDFVVLENRKPLQLIEVKEADDEVSRDLRYLHQRHASANAIQLVRQRSASETLHSCRVVPAGEWLAKELLRED
jgi:predicted AAA+ superfamily ATPase